MDNDIYVPKFLYAALKLPADTRTDKERACDRFVWFVKDILNWGVEDAVDLARSEKNPLRPHNSDCESCRDRFNRNEIRSLDFKPTEIEKAFRIAAEISANKN